MTRYVLSAELGQKDTYTPPLESNEQLISLDLLDSTGKLRHGISRALSDLKRLNLQPTPLGVDLLILAVIVHAADTRINRMQASQDGWTREIKLVVPVSNSNTWKKTESLLSKTLKFLSGDLWEVTFRSWPKNISYPVGSPSLNIDDIPYDNVSLFSGGLDSLIGAIDCVENGERTLFASHAGGDGAVSSPQKKLFTAFEQEYKNKAAINRVRLALRFDSELLPELSGENSTRARSFLFFALGVMAGSSFKKEFSLRVPENGLISLNVPLDATRLGSNSTRTTHPYYIHRWNELLNTIEIPCKIYNPYWDKTKGEMIKKCKSQKILKKLAPTSVSCAHPAYKRYAQDDVNHCGCCLPCVIRRASFLSAWGKSHDPTDYRVANLEAQPLDSTKADGVQIRAVQYALLRIKKNPKLADVWIHKPGPLLEDTNLIHDLADVYKRGMAEVEAVVKSVKIFSSKV